jgi:hypothetical protein
MHKIIVLTLISRVCLINSKTARIMGKVTGYKMCVSFFSTAVVRNIFGSDKYLRSYARDARRNART